jgi:hypothetical protein
MSLEVKAGDKVVIHAHYGRATAEVLEITSAGDIRLTTGRLYSPTGYLKTRDTRNNSWIEPLTPEIEEDMRRNRVIANAWQAMYDTRSLTYEQAVAILRILSDKGGDEA